MFGALSCVHTQESGIAKIHVGTPETGRDSKQCQPRHTKQIASERAPGPADWLRAHKPPGAAKRGCLPARNCDVEVQVAVSNVPVASDHRGPCLSRRELRLQARPYRIHQAVHARHRQAHIVLVHRACRAAGVAWRCWWGSRDSERQREYGWSFIDSSIHLSTLPSIHSLMHQPIDSGRATNKQGKPTNSFGQGNQQIRVSDGLRVHPVGVNTGGSAAVRRRIDGIDGIGGIRGVGDSNN
eukprot:351548-Chlamydomonas_euryale.AAC.6